MPGHKTWAVGEEVVYSEFNPYIADQIVAVFASAAARTTGWPTPPVGALSYLTGTKRYETWDGAAWVPPGPFGVLGRAILTVAGAAGSPAIIDVGTMSVAVTVANATRLIRVDAFAHLICGSGGGANASLMIREGSTTLAEAVSSSWLAGPGVVDPFYVSCLLVPTAGAHTYKMSVQFTANADNSVSASATRPAYLLVTDIGPST